jgi:hypothetical protein
MFFLHDESKANRRASTHILIGNGLRNLARTEVLVQEK